MQLLESEIMQDIIRTAEKAAPTDAPVLILGENGTGKEVLAKHIHRMSSRSGNQFVCVDLGSLVPTLFESEMFGHMKGSFTGASEEREGRFMRARGGTLFLDELGNLHPQQQTKLLTAIEQGEVVPVGSSTPVKTDARIISATNRDIRSMVEEGMFREDLYYRLNTIVLELPPLRERREDIPRLVNHFIDIFSEKYKKKGLKPGRARLNELTEYHWPGNIRELRHMVERAVIMSEGGKFTGDSLIPASAGRSTPRQCRILSLEENEKNLIREALRHARGNMSLAARILGISRKTLYNKTARYGI